MEQDSQEMIYSDFESDGSTPETTSKKPRKVSTVKVTRPRTKPKLVRGAGKKKTIEWSSDDDEDTDKHPVKAKPSPSKRGKRPSPQAYNSSEDEARDDKRLKRKKSEVITQKSVSLDLSEKVESPREIPPFKAYLGKRWWVANSFFHDKNYFTIRQFANNTMETPLRGATLGIEFLPIVRSGLNKLHQHVDKYLEKN